MLLASLGARHLAPLGDAGVVDVVILVGFYFLFLIHPRCVQSHCEWIRRSRVSLLPLVFRAPFFFMAAFLPFWKSFSRPCALLYPLPGMSVLQIEI